jgi:hypothetical protein
MKTSERRNETVVKSYPNQILNKSEWIIDSVGDEDKDEVLHPHDPFPFK